MSSSSGKTVLCGTYHDVDLYKNSLLTLQCGCSFKISIIEDLFRHFSAEHQSDDEQQSSSSSREDQRLNNKRPRDHPSLECQHLVNSANEENENVAALENIYLEEE